MLQQKIEQDPTIHPATTSIGHFDFPESPPDHIRRLYAAVYEAVEPDFPDALRKIAALMPRGHGKSEAGAVVVPVWLTLRYPQAKTAIISKTQSLASERVQRAGTILEDYLDLPVNQKSTLRTRQNVGEKEPSLSAHGMNSQITGGHYDLIVFDDVVDYENQRIESRRKKLREQFRDYTQNLEEKDSAIGGTVQIVIGTRKHPEDLYQTEILSDRSWRVFEEKALSDWSVVADGQYEIEATDDQTYEEPSDIPEDVAPRQDGVYPTRDVDVLWPSHKPVNEILFDVVFGDRSNAVWRRENQNDPRALSGSVFTADMLSYVPELPRSSTAYSIVAGIDQAHIDSAQAAAEGDTDYWAIAVIAHDGDQGFLLDLRRTRGIHGEDASEWIKNSLDHDVDLLRIESNFAQSNMVRRLREDIDAHVEGVTTTRDKMTRYQNDLAPDFQSARLQIVGEPSEDRWQSWEEDEWLQHPDATHDDRTDAIDFANVDQTGGFVDPDEIGLNI